MAFALAIGAALVGVAAMIALLASLWIVLQSKLGDAGAALIVGVIGLLISGGLLWLAHHTTESTK